VIARQQGRQNQVHNVWFGRPEAARRGNDGNLIFISHEHEVAGFHRRQEPFHLGADFQHGLSDYIFGAGGSGSRGHQDHARLGAQQVLHGARNRMFVLGAGQHVVGVHAEALQSLAHDVLKELAATLAAEGIAVENPNTWGADRTRLKNRPPFFEDSDHGIQLVLGDRKRRALDGRDALPGHRVSIIERGRDHHARSAVNLLQEFVVHQHAAVFGGHQVGPATRREADLEAAATHFAGDGANGIILADLAVLQFRHPDGFHTFGFQDADVLITDHVALGEEFLAARPENSAAQDSAS
jgi:hypothetical protein